MDVGWETIKQELRKCSTPWLPPCAHGRSQLVPFATARRLERSLCERVVNSPTGGEEEGLLAS